MRATREVSGTCPQWEGWFFKTNTIREWLPIKLSFSKAELLRQFKQRCPISPKTGIPPGLRLV